MSTRDPLRLTEELLDSHNWDPWRKRAELQMKARGLWSAIDPGTPTSGATAAESDKEAKAMAALISSVHDKHSDTVYRAKTAKDAWAALEAPHIAAAGPRRHMLELQVHGLRKQPGESVADYIGRARTLQSELQRIDPHAGGNIPTALVAGLPPDYATTADLLVQSVRTLTIDSVANAVIASETFKRSQEGAALFSTHPLQQQGGYHHQGGQRQQDRRPQQQQGGQRQQERRSQQQQGRGQGRGRRQRRQNRRGGQPQERQDFNHAFSASAMSAAAQTTGQWVCDSGATHHMTWDKSCLQDYQPATTPTTVTFGQGAKSVVEGKGTAVIHTVLSSGRRGTLHLMDCLYVPGLQANLISIPKVTAAGGRVSFKANRCTIGDRQGLYAVATKQQSLYVVQDTAAKHTARCSLAVATQQPLEACCHFAVVTEAAPAAAQQLPCTPAAPAAPAAALQLPCTPAARAAPAAAQQLPCTPAAPAAPAPAQQLPVFPAAAASALYASKPRETAELWLAT
jgi:gag-polypeptide of LTR copia-type